MLYPVRLTLQRDAGNYAVRFPDIPEALTIGDSVPEALKHGLDALETALDFYFEHGHSVPLPSPRKRGQQVVEVPPSLSAKVLLHNEMLSQGVRPAELARRLAMPRQNVNRLLNPRHDTKIDAVAAALKVLGKTLEMQAI